MKKITKCFTNPYISTSLAIALSMVAGSAVAHDPGSLGPGTPVCIESNLMAADAENAPFSNQPGPGRVIEMNVTTGTRGITVERPFNAGNAGTPICTNGGVDCPGPWKPTGVLSGGEDGHAIITSAAQHAHTTFHRNGTPIKTGPVLPTSPSPNGGGYGWVPRLLGSGYMPNGNIAQAVCDANFFNASNSDPFAAGESAVDPATGNPRPDNSSWMYFPPVYSNATRGANGRILVIDQETLEAIDEYSMPTTGPYANDPRWNCPAGVIFTSEGLYISMFHGDAVFVVDWKAGIDKASRGVGSNVKHGCGNSSDDDGDACTFKLGKTKNEARIIRVIDMSNDGTLAVGGALNYDDSATNFDSPNRRDNLRAIRMSEDGTLFGTRRSRSAGCTRGQAPGASPSVAGVCNPSVFRQHIFTSSPGSSHRSGSIALDPGVNVLAGVTINRMSGPGCDFVTADAIANGNPTDDVCDVETLYFGTSAGNAGCDADGDGLPGPGHPANQCFKPGGTIYEYRIDVAHWDGGARAGDGSGLCDGNPATPATNTGCAMPIAQFDFVSDGITSGLP
ncbi:MAG TPA: hypothetical protein ENI75_03800, partial [Mizugakiibacter sp.]|nr:hypothetical protein [Mizugakiibacter sp.]